MNKKKLYVIGGIVCLLIGIGLLYTSTRKESNETAFLHADYPQYDNASDIVNSSDLIFSGKVIKIRNESLNIANEEENAVTGYNEESPMFPYTIYTIQIDQIHKGTLTENTIELKCLGGELDGISYVLDESTNIEVGNTYLFLAKSYPSGYPSLINATQGAYHLDDPQTISSESSEHQTISVNDILKLLQ